MQSLQSDKLACPTNSAILIDFHARTGGRHTRYKILFIKMHKNCWEKEQSCIRDGHRVKLLTFQNPHNCCIKIIETWILKSEGSGLSSDAVMRTEVRLN